MWGCTVVEHCEVPGTSCVGSRTINKPSMESLHGFNPMVHHAIDHRTYSSSVGAVKSGEAVDNNAVDESPSI